MGGSGGAGVERGRVGWCGFRGGAGAGRGKRGCELRGAGRGMLEVGLGGGLGGQTSFFLGLSQEGGGECWCWLDG